MNGAPRGLLWLTTIVTLVTGLAYAGMRYLLVSDDPFSAHGHPLQPWALAIHVIVAPVMVFATGWFWGLHVLPKLRREAVARHSGIALTSLAAVMIGSGYGLQVLAEPWARTAFAWAHGVSGVLFAGLLAGHQLIGRRATRSAREAPDRSAADRHIQVVSRTDPATRSGIDPARAESCDPVTTARRSPPLSSLDSKSHAAAPRDGGAIGKAH